MIKENKGKRLEYAVYGGYCSKAIPSMFKDERDSPRLRGRDRERERRRDGVWVQERV